jgi:hypothetical protein
VEERKEASEKLDIRVPSAKSNKRAHIAAGSAYQVSVRLARAPARAATRMRSVNIR